MNFNKRKVIDLTFLVSCFLLLFLFSLFALSIVGFIFHIPINIFYPILSFFLSFGILYFYTKSKNMPLIYMYILAPLFFVLLFLAMFISGNFYDLSWDGRSYHQASVILLEKGWNPVYDNVENFALKFYDTKLFNLIWVENYPKFVEIIQANIYKIFHSNIEATKCVGFLFGFALFGYSFFVLNKENFKNINIVLKLLISTAIVLNPVTIAQILTFYVDYCVYLFFMLLIFAIIDIETSHKRNLVAISIFGMSLVSLVNIKLGGVLYVVVVLFAYLGLLFVCKRFKRIKEIFLCLILSLILIIFSSINPYYTNIKQDRHPLYPLAGEGKKEIILPSTPRSIAEKNNFQKFLITTFSRVDNFGYAHDNKHHIKFPFWVYSDELTKLTDTDVRLSGFGVFWSGILILGLFLSIFIRYDNKEQKQLHLLVFAMLILLTLLNPFAWWARYVAHLWFLPIWILIAIFNNERIKKYQFVLGLLLLFFIFANSIITSVCIVKNGIEKTKNTKQNIRTIKEKNANIKIYELYDWGYINKFLENGVKFEFVNEEFYEANKKDFSKMNFVISTKMFWDYKE